MLTDVRGVRSAYVLAVVVCEDLLREALATLGTDAVDLRGVVGKLLAAAAAADGEVGKAVLCGERFGGDSLNDGAPVRVPFPLYPSLINACPPSDLGSIPSGRSSRVSVGP